MTGTYVLFQMWGPFRQSLIDGHLFYVEQARKRLLTQFENIEAEADKASEDWLENNSHRFDPDRDDPGSFYEAAGEAGIEFYRLLSDMRDQTQLSVVAGMFHEWDKQLRDWLVREIGHWHRGIWPPKKSGRRTFQTSLTCSKASVGRSAAPGTSSCWMPAVWSSTSTSMAKGRRWTI